MTFSFKLGHIYILLVSFYQLRSGCLGYDPEASITGLYTGPYFDPLAPRNLTAHLDDRAVLPCTVRQLGDKSVSWIRIRDADILTVDSYTFVSDDRFEAHYSALQETWNLVIKYVQERDAGQYECQVSTEPKMSQLFNLRVVVPRVSMLPPGDRYVKAGSQVRIDCQISDVVQQPDYIFWYHDGVRVLENQDSNLNVMVKKTGEESIMSTLTISKVRRDESGNYTCMPSNLHASSVLLHVLNEEHPEAMKDGRNASGKMEQPIYLFLLFVLCTTLGHIFKRGSCLPDTETNKRDRKRAMNRSQLANVDKSVNAGMQNMIGCQMSEKSKSVSRQMVFQTDTLDKLKDIVCRMCDRNGWKSYVVDVAQDEVRMTGIEFYFDEKKIMSIEDLSNDVTHLIDEYLSDAISSANLTRNEHTLKTTTKIETTRGENNQIAPSNIQKPIHHKLIVNFNHRGEILVSTKAIGNTNNQNAKFYNQDMNIAQNSNEFETHYPNSTRPSLLATR